MAEAEPKMHVRLAGVLEVADDVGHVCRIRSAKGRALIALLATATGMKRSREWLRALLWDRADERSSADNLRQELFKLRDNLGPLSTCLKADPISVWLQGASVDTDGGDSAVVSFFEDAPTKLGEEFEDWLRLERDRFDTLHAARPPPVPTIEARTVPVPVAVAESAVQMRAMRPCVVLAPAVTRCTNLRADVLAAFATDQICDVFRLNGMVDVFDLRDMQTDQLTGLGEAVTRTAQAVVTATLIEIGDTLAFSVAAREQTTRRVLWKSSIMVDQTGDALVSPQQIGEFVVLAVEAIERLVCHAAASGSEQPDGPVSLYAMVHQLFSVSKSGVASAKRMLRTVNDASPDPIAAAWLAFSTVFAVGENFEGRDAIVDEAEAWAYRALESDPSNPLVLALVSHVLAYVLDERGQARELVDRSRRLAPTLALAADVSAIQHLYASDLEKGMSEAALAIRLGRFSPYRFWFDSTAAIGATLTGDHARALDISRSVLRARPGFLAVMRHACASMVELEDYDGATRLFEDIRGVDADFGTRAMNDRAYPLPSARSRETIVQALSKMRRLE